MKTTAILLMFVGPVVLKAECCPGSPVDTTVGTNESNSSTDTPTQGESGFTSEPETSTTGTSSETTSTAPTTGGTVCGDGSVDHGEERDSTERCNDCLLDRVVFNTGFDHRWTGRQIGGLPRADEKCNILARTHGLDGPDGAVRFRAWLSSETSDIADRNIPAAGRYVRVDGAVVAESWEALLAGQLVSPPRITASGNDTFDQPTWTGTIGGGLWGGPGSCEGWTTDNGSAILGIAASNGPGWSEWKNPAPCSQALSLYCIEQPGMPVCHLGACKQTADCPFGTECFPLVPGVGTLLCGLPCKTDDACTISCTEGQPTPITTCGATGLCEPVACDENTGCNCQSWFNGVHVCMS